MNLLKPTDTAIPGMSESPGRNEGESPGRNEGEPTGDLDRKKIRRPSPLCSGEGNMAWRNLTDATRHSGGVVGAAR